MVAERFYGSMDEQAFADFLRVCFPLLSSYELTSDVIIRADWRPDVLIGWMLGESRELDLREELSAIEAPTLVLAGEDDAWAPPESVQEVVEHLPDGTRFRSFGGARHSVFRDAPGATEELLSFVASLQTGRTPREGGGPGDRALLRRRRRGAGAGRSLCAAVRPSSSSTRARGSTIPPTRSTSARRWRRSGRSSTSTSGAPDAATGATASTGRSTTWVEDVREFCEVLELERPVVLGTAFGGSIGLLLAARYPERVARLVLVSTVARYVHTRAIAVFDRLGGPRAGEVAARYFADPSETTFAEFLRVCVPLYTRNPSADAFARIEMNFALTAHWDRNERHFDLRDEAALVSCPTLVLAGEDDPSTTVAGTEELLAALPAELTRLHRFAAAGHGVFRDAPEALELVREFVLADAK